MEETPCSWWGLIRFNAVSYSRYLLINRNILKIRLFVTDGVMDLTVTFIQWQNSSDFSNWPNLSSLLLRKEATIYLIKYTPN